ncbi:MAG: SCP2 sterol-binding domain-containing protein [Acidobacteria bacterium]|nr:SCP2 sterol-binding domain-containing protein [Acidobacteriota bacterium]
MAVKFLSDEYLSQVQDRLNAHDGFQSAVKGQSAKLQQEITGGPDGDIRYWVSIDGGKVGVGGGSLDGAEATLVQSYETAVAMAKGELAGQAAFMQGKLKIQGNLMKIMQLQGAFASMVPALEGLDVQY